MARMFLRAFFFAALAASWSRAAAVEPIAPEHYDKLRQLVKPQPGESRFWEIPWMLNLDEAIQKAAAEGKPIFLWSGAGGPPHTVC